MINSWDSVYKEDINGVIKLEGYFKSKKEYLLQAHEFLSIVNQRLSIDKPIINFEYKNKFRINAIHNSISFESVVFTIRKSAQNLYTEEFFVQNNFFSKKQDKFLKELVRSRKTIFISGGTSSGKTTLLNYLLRFLNKDERIVVIEDTREILVDKIFNVVYLNTRIKELGLEEISTSDLVKTSLRMRPDRIILGEIRRDEVVDFLHAINTGHRGSISTGHGNSEEDMLSRLEILLLEANIPNDAARMYLGRGIDYIIQLGSKSNRCIKSISKVEYKLGELKLSEVL